MISTSIHRRITTDQILRNAHSGTSGVPNCLSGKTIDFATKPLNLDKLPIILHNYGRKIYHMVGIMNKYALQIIGLFRHNYAASYHVRQIAGLLKISHVTLLPYLKELENTKVLCVKSSGKNKLFSLNLSNILTKDYLLLAEKTAAIAFLEEYFLFKKIYVEIFEISPAGAVVLFGSYAKRTQTSESDIDLLYIGNNGVSFAGQMKKIGALLGKAISVKCTTLSNFEKGLREKDSLIWEVLEQHVILYDPTTFIDSAWRYYGKIR
ncbi:MAG: nucleotidyltransferase domain-containing protein [Candidatus Glassbacteria bacterium]